MECLELVMDLQSKIFDLKKLILPHPLTNFEIQKYYENEPRFNGSSSRDNLSKKNKRWDICNNPDEYSSI